ncbi:ATP phosphoribosyltransferase [Thermicanus aegyptius]|uniref:ATP phosphoribosyltransferase n=1 Tax=Thermicanus aegyptius TaxID=94009 RepID=UPI000406D599|nr:ATP phosphoribosyltransferase [Thermicanus aegyptius]
MRELRLALPKGRILDDALLLLKEQGYPLPEEIADTRKLLLAVPEAGLELILAKPMDVPTYVEYGVADVGIVGKDVLMEVERDVYELLDLGISPCRLSVAGLPEPAPSAGLMRRVATKYPNVAERYFRDKGEQVEIIHLNGSIELAPILGLADRIVDIVSTGRTLKENGLVELEPIAPITSRLIANRSSYRLRGKIFQELIDRLGGERR